MEIIHCNNLFEYRGRELFRVTTNGDVGRGDCAYYINKGSQEFPPTGFSTYLVHQDDIALQKDNLHQSDVISLAEPNALLGEHDIVRIDRENDNLQVLYKSGLNDNCLFLTNRCNSKCIMCPQRPQEDKIDLFKQNLDLIDIIKDCPQYLTLTGGEPTLLGDKLIEIINKCSLLLPDTKLMLLSNAKKFSDLTYTKKLADAGKASLAVAVPIYASESSRHDQIVGVSGSFEKSVRGCHNLALFKVPIEIRVVVLKKNYTILKNIAEFVYRNLTFSFRVVFMGMEMRDLAVENFNDVYINPIEYKEHLLSACKYLKNRGIQVQVYNLPLCLLDSKLWSLSAKSISNWKNRYTEKCQKCTLKRYCGGLFDANKDFFRDIISPILC